MMTLSRSRVARPIACDSARARSRSPRREAEKTPPLPPPAGLPGDTSVGAEGTLPETGVHHRVSRNLGGDVKDGRRVKTVQALCGRGVDRRLAIEMEKGIFEKALEEAFKNKSLSSLLAENVDSEIVFDAKFAAGGGGSSSFSTTTPTTTTPPPTPSSFPTPPPFNPTNVLDALQKGVGPISNNRMLSKPEYREYNYVYRRILQFLRSNQSLLVKMTASTADPLTTSLAFCLPFLSNAELESDQMRERRERAEGETMEAAMALLPTDDPRWTGTDVYTCKRCQGTKCLMLVTMQTNRKEDQSDEPVITVRCDNHNCEYLWKDTNQESFSG